MAVVECLRTFDLRTSMKYPKFHKPALDPENANIIVITRNRYWAFIDAPLLLLLSPMAVLMMIYLVYCLHFPGISRVQNWGLYWLFLFLGHTFAT